MEDTLDPVCEMKVDPATATDIRDFNGVRWFFCSPDCATEFDADPAGYTEGAPESALTD